MTQSREQMAMHRACHEAHARDWPVGAKVWADWGIQGWVPAVVVGHTRIRVRVRMVGRAPKTGYNPLPTREYGYRAPNNLRPRKDGERVPPPKKQHETCLFLAERVKKS